MPFDLEDRPSDSPYVDSIWRTESGDVSRFLSMAVTSWAIVFTRRHGTTRVTVRGPETRVSWADCPDEAEFFGIQFKLGAFMPHLPLDALVDSSLDLPQFGRSFRLDGSAWELPGYDNADVFLARLERQGLLVRDPVVESVLDGRRADVSPRTVQRRFLNASGLTSRAIRQIERARQATAMLRKGHSILAVVEAAGYADQSHLTRALRRLVGQTPAELRRRSVDLSRLERRLAATGSLLTPSVGRCF